MPGYAQLRALWHLRVPDRYLVVRTYWDGVPVYFHNVYAPVTDSERPEFFASLPRHFDDDDAIAVHIVGGDFNLPVNAALDASSYLDTNNDGKAEMLEWLAALRTVDAWRTMYPTSYEYSGPHELNRIDYLFIDRALVEHHLQSASYGKKEDFKSDHRPHTVVLAASPVLEARRPKAVWRLPRELLDDPRTVRAIQAEAEGLLAELVADPDCNVGSKWCGWLRRMKTHMRQGQYNRQRRRATVLDGLRRRHAVLKVAARSGRATEFEVSAAGDAYKEAKAETRQANLDSGFDRHANLNEVASSLFLRKPPSLKVPITSATRDGVTTTHPTAVNEIFTAHWAAIMRLPPDEPPPDPVHQAEVIDYVTAALTDEQRAALDRPLDEEELSSAISTMPKNKSPGPDGWPAAFFQVAPATFAAILVRVFEYQRSERGVLLEHQRRSSVTLLYKKGDRSLPGNYRPIALMPIEVKILSRAMARRLSVVASTLIHPTQAGFVQGRAMADHIHLVYALQHKATQQQQPWVATFLDYAKAYDMVRQDFMLKVMEKMRIGPEFLGWVKLLYKEPEVRLLLNGSLGPAIRPTRGVKQGCPLSCLLFDLYLEPLGAMLRAQPELGIPMKSGDEVSSWITGVFFADDSTLLSNSLQSAERQLADIVAPFCAASGAALNQDKCVTLVLDGTASVDQLERQTTLSLSATGAPVRFLGAYVGHNLAPEYQEQLISDKFMASFAQWQCRARTVKGRRTLASAMLLGLVWHMTAITPISDKTLERWQKMLNHYVTGNKTSPDDKYRAPISQDWFFDKSVGLGIPHIASCISGQRLRLLQRFMAAAMSESPPAWAVLALEQFEACMQTAYRPTHPFDFLSYTPEHASKWLELSALHPIWKDVWVKWKPVLKKLKMPAAPDLATALSTPLTPDLATTLSMPMWLTRHPEFCHGAKETTPASLVSQRPAASEWLRRGAAKGYYCLRDIITNMGTGGVWPTWRQFSMSMSTTHADNRVQFDAELDQIVLRGQSYTKAVYNHLSDVYTNVLTRTGTPLDAVLLDVAVASHPFRAKVKDAVLPFEQWPRRLVNKMAYHAPVPSKPTPTYSVRRPDRTAAAAYMGLFRRSLSWLTHVHADVWFRATMNMMPVAARYNYPDAPHPMTCPHDCGRIETVGHALRLCPKQAPMWAEHQKAWTSVGVSLEWYPIMNVDLFKVNARGELYKAALYRLWVMLVGVAMHQVWSHRNHRKHRDRQIPPTHALVEVSFLLWMSTVRRWLRLQGADDLDANATRAALALLFRQAPYAALRARHPRCLHLDSSFDVH